MLKKFQVVVVTFVLGMLNATAETAVFPSVPRPFADYSVVNYTEENPVDVAIRKVQLLSVANAVSGADAVKVQTWLVQAAPNVRYAVRQTVLTNGQVELCAYTPNQVLVTLETNRNEAEFKTAMAARGLSVKSKLMKDSDGNSVFIVDAENEDGDVVDRMMASIRSTGFCGAKIYRNRVYSMSAIPNDTSWNDQWNMVKIGAPDAWDATTDASGVIVAVLDTGVNYTHFDLNENLWTNSGEVNGSANGVDDDGNGIPDDVFGMRCIGGMVSGNPMDDHGHGSHCAGIIGAIGNNNIGIAGVAWKVKIMALKFMDEHGNGSVADAIRCLNYAEDNGARIVNCSWFVKGQWDDLLSERIKSLGDKGVIFVCAAGNDSTGGSPTDLDQEGPPTYPACFTHSNIVAVAASDVNDKLMSNSFFGERSVDIAAPGENIYSTGLGGMGFQSQSGTSTAASHVTGALALLMSYYPDASSYALVQKLYDCGMSVDSLRGCVKTGKRLSLKGMFEQQPPSEPTLPVSAAESVRYEALSDGCPIVVTGTELRGELDGSAVTEWNTLLSEDGWLTLSSGGASAEVLVLNTPKVVGGRLAANETWGADRIRVVRSDVIVPNGVTLTLSAGCIVKFLPGAKIVAEDGGAIRAEGAMLADFADDSVGGDTNLDEDETIPSGTEWWMESPAVAALAAVSFFDGTEKAAPRRVYSVGATYGELPALHKDGLLFGGWFTALNGAGTRVTAQTAVSASVSALYAQWTPFTIGLEPAELATTALSGAFSFAVSANGPWTATTEAGWITLTATAGEGDGEVAFTLAQNASTEARSATIRVALANGGSQDFTVTQEGMTAVATPVINPADGTTFSGSARRCSVTCATDGASIYYTLDGSEPDEASKLYPGKSFNVFDSVTIKAKAFKAGMLPSETVVSRVIRLQTLAEAIDQPLWAVTSGGDAEWGVTIDETSDGKSAAQSGMIGDDEESWMQTTVEGSGTLTFQWKVFCEDDPDSVEDDPYSYTWDYLELAVDGSVVCRVDGDSGWQKVSVKIKGEGTHTVRWTYVKDYMQDDYTMEDGAWVDQVSWAPSVGEAEVPVSWLEGLGVVGSDGSAKTAADLDSDGDGLTTAEEYIIGTDPTDPDSTFRAKIEMVDGKPVITYTPDLLNDRKYIKWGRQDLGDPTEEWTPVPEGREDDYNFFKVSVEMP